MSEGWATEDGRREARIDRAIDGAVREMLAVEPRADLHARVMAQVAASRSQLPAYGIWEKTLVYGFTRSRVVLTAVAAAAMVLAVLVMRRPEALPQGPLAVRGVDQHLPAEVLATSSIEEKRPIVADSRVAARVPAPREAIALEAAPQQAQPARSGGTVFAAAYLPDDDAAGTAPEPLKTIAPIAVAPVTQESIAPADITMPPLKPMSEVHIAPLTPPDRR